MHAARRRASASRSSCVNIGSVRVFSIGAFFFSIDGLFRNISVLMIRVLFQSNNRLRLDILEEPARERSSAATAVNCITENGGIQ